MTRNVFMPPLKSSVIEKISLNRKFVSSLQLHSMSKLQNVMIGLTARRHSKCFRIGQRENKESES